MTPVEPDTYTSMLERSDSSTFVSTQALCKHWKVSLLNSISPNRLGSLDVTNCLGNVKMCACTCVHACYATSASMFSTDLRGEATIGPMTVKHAEKHLVGLSTKLVNDDSAVLILFHALHWVIPRLANTAPANRQACGQLQFTQAVLHAH